MPEIRWKKHLEPRERKERNCLTFFLEGEISGEMATFMVSPKHQERVGVSELQRVHVQ